MTGELVHREATAAMMGMARALHSAAGEGEAHVRYLFVTLDALLLVATHPAAS